MAERLWVQLNGERRELPDDGRRLIDWLRTDLGLTGSKEPCGSGQCGGCSVLLDGEVVLSCCLLARTVANHEIQTIEGLAQGPAVDPLVDSFVRFGAVQCGYCTPGMIVASRALLNRTIHTSYAETRVLDEKTVRQGLAGNICRCTGYVQIVQAVLETAHQEEEQLTCQ